MEEDSLHVKVSRSVVALGIRKDNETLFVDGIVVASSQEYISIIAHPANLTDNMFKAKHGIFVVLPNRRKILLDRQECTSKGGIFWIKCLNPTPGVECGFGDLVAFTFCGQDVQEHDKVYAYTDHFTCKLLTPGRVLLVEDRTFDHNCGAYKRIESGEPVINGSGELVGMCDFYREGYFTAHKVSEIARVRSQFVGTYYDF